MARLDVLWLPSELEAAAEPPHAVVVIDAIRATTSIATALAAGAQRVIPAPTVAAARERATRAAGALLCGERNGRAPAGFDLGNSPHEYTPERVAGRTLVFTTTNGTRAVEAARGAADLWLACFRNATAVVGELARGPLAGGAPLAIVCAGRRGRISMDDAWCAGHLVRRIEELRSDVSWGEGARVARALARSLGAPTAQALARTEAGRALDEVGLAADLSVCASLDDLEVVPVLRDGAFVQGGEEDADVG